MNVIDDEDELPFPDRPRLRYIDEYLRPNFFNFSKRYTLAILISIANAILFATKSNVCVYSSFDDDSSDYNESSSANVTQVYRDYFEFHLDGCFILPYMFVQIPAGIIAYKYQGTRIFGLCILISSIITFFTPVFELYSRKTLLWGAFLQGIFQGAVVPAAHAVWQHWAPPLERTTLTAISYAGTYVGVVFGVFFSRELCEHMAWTKVLYFYGFIGIVWYFVWIWLVFELPNQHPTIKENEIVYLKETLGQTNQKPPIPWRHILWSGPTFAIMVAYVCRAYNSFYIIQADYSQYNFTYTFGHGFFITLPQALMAICVPLCGYLTDMALRKTSLSITNLRKLLISGSFIAQSLWLLIGASVNPSSTYFVICYILDVLMYTISITNFHANHVDIAPRYASILMGLTNVLGTIASAGSIFLEGPSFTMPVEVQHTIFIISAGIHIFSAGFYGLLGSGEVQSWAKAKETPEEPDRPIDENDTNTRRILVR